MPSAKRNPRSSGLIEISSFGINFPLKYAVSMNAMIVVKDY
jgi:hypothetical protein